MEKVTRISFLDQPLFRVFSSIKDPRVGGRCLYPLFDIIFIVLCAMIAGADGWKAIENFAKKRRRWLSQFINLENGIPSQFTLARVFSRINTEEAVRYYITSIPFNMNEKMCEAIRTHWCIENKLHYKLDVGMHEDRCQIYRGVADQNLAAMRKLILAMLEKEKSFKGGIELKRHETALSTRYLRKVVEL